MMTTDQARCLHEIYSLLQTYNKIYTDWAAEETDNHMILVLERARAAFLYLLYTLGKGFPELS